MFVRVHILQYARQKKKGFLKYKTGDTVDCHSNDPWLFHLKGVFSEPKESIQLTFQLQPIIITQGRDSSVRLYLVMVSIYPNAILNKQYLAEVPRHKTDGPNPMKHYI